MNNRQKEKIKGYRILSIEAKDLYELIKKNESYEICDENGNINFDKFSACVYDSIETDKLREVYAKRRDVKGKFELKDYEKEFGSKEYGATLALINIKFNKSAESVSKEKLRKLLYNNEVQIKTKRPSGKKGEKQELHETVNRYVRYKRSAGSSREGSCLFILKQLKNDMMKWTSCGLNKEKIADKVSWESYVSLTLSNAKTKIYIPKESILFIPDAKSTSSVDAIAITTNENHDIAASEENVQVTNTIWDGQALLDESVFESNASLKGKGMALLRNRFFKTCAFNTKLQKWFSDNKITEVSQLNKNFVTLAEKISDIKLVVTDSSLKYIKLKQSEKNGEAGRSLTKEESNNINIEAKKYWLEHLEEAFGVVKTDKPTKFFDGKMVQTSYQLINTLDLDEDALENLLTPAIDYWHKIRTIPAYMRYYLNGEINSSDDDIARYDFDIEEESDDDDNSDNIKLRKKINHDLLYRNDDYSKTHLYGDFLRDTRKGYFKKLKCGKLLVSGTNATLFGNGYEMLVALTDDSYDFESPESKALANNQIRISHFDDGQELLGARSPHITMGNIFLATNKISDDDYYSKYFNLTPEIVCINCIGNCLMDRLNGCDFDSDTMLLTDNSIFLEAAKKHYDYFKVPICKLEKKDKTESELYKIDTVIAQNEIGRIINTSQWMNSLFWTKFHRGENCTNLYREICKLAVLSGTEIDKAKRDYGIDASDVLEGVKEQINIGKQRPGFMKVVRKKELTEKDIQKLRKGGVLYSDDFDTAMQTLQYVVSKLSEQETKSYKEKKRVGISTLLCGLEDKKLTNEYDYKNEIISKALLENQALELWRKDATFQTDQTEKKFCWEKCNEIEQRVLEFVKKKMKNEYVLNLLIKELDDPSSSVQSVKSLLLSCICSANHSLLDQVMITGQRNSRSVISMDDDGDIEIFGIKHRTEIV